MKASDLFIKALENEGVEYIFGIPNEENLDLLDSLRDSTILHRIGPNKMISYEELYKSSELYISEN